MEKPKTSTSTSEKSTMMTTSTTTISDLSDDLLLKILKKLDIEDLITFRTVCPQWAAVITDNLIGVAVAINDENFATTCARTTDKNVRYIGVKNLQKPLAGKNIHNPENISNLYIDFDTSAIASFLSTSLKAKKSDYFVKETWTNPDPTVSNRNIIYLLENCKNLMSLFMNVSSMAGFTGLFGQKTFAKISFQDLRYLVVTVGPKDYQPLFQGLFNMDFPSLKTCALQFEIPANTFTLEECKWLFHFVNRVRGTLELLHIKNAPCASNMKSKIKRKGKTRGSSTTQHLLTNAYSHVQFQLKHLHLEMEKELNVERKLEIEFLHTLCSLTSMTLAGVAVPDVMQAVKMNSQTLKILDIKNTPGHQSANKPGLFDCAYLENCKNLIIFTIEDFRVKCLQKIPTTVTLISITTFYRLEPPTSDTEEVVKLIQRFRKHLICINLPSLDMPAVNRYIFKNSIGRTSVTSSKGSSLHRIGILDFENQHKLNGQAAESNFSWIKEGTAKKVANEKKAKTKETSGQITYKTTIKKDQKVVFEYSSTSSCRKDQKPSPTSRKELKNFAKEVKKTVEVSLAGEINESSTQNMSLEKVKYEIAGVLESKYPCKCCKVLNCTVKREEVVVSPKQAVDVKQNEKQIPLKVQQIHEKIEGKNSTAQAVPTSTVDLKSRKIARPKKTIIRDSLEKYLMLEEVLTVFFSKSYLVYLDIKNMRKCRLISKTWKTAAEKFVCFGFWLNDQTSSWVQNSTVPLRFLAVSQLQNLLDTTKTEFVRQVNAIVFEVAQSSFEDDPLGKRPGTDLDVHFHQVTEASIKEDNIRFILNAASQAKTLCLFFNKWALSNFLGVPGDRVFLAKGDFDFLRMLSVIVTGSVEIAHLTTILSVNFPNLKIFLVKYDYGKKTCTLSQYESLFLFIVNHKSLSRLSITSPPLPPAISKDRKGRNEAKPTIACQKIKEDSFLIQLKDLTIDMTNNPFKWILGLLLIREQRHLKKMRIRGINPKILTETINKSSETLETIEINAAGDQSSAGDYSFEFETKCLTNCKKLLNLNLHNFTSMSGLAQNIPESLQTLAISIGGMKKTEFFSLVGIYRNLTTLTLQPNETIPSLTWTNWFDMKFKKNNKVKKIKQERLNGITEILNAVKVMTYCYGSYWEFDEIQNFVRTEKPSLHRRNSWCDDNGFIPRGNLCLCEK